MKKLILIIALFVGITSFAQGRKGEGRPNPEEQVEKLVTRMTAELDLNAKQQEQIKVLMVPIRPKKRSEKSYFQNSKRNWR